MWRKQNATVCTGTATAETICSTRRQTGFTARIAESGNMVSNKRMNAAQEAVAKEARRRRAEAVAMQANGKSLKEIGDHFGVTRERARQLVAAGIRDQQEATA